MPTGLAEHAQRDLHAGTRHQPIVYGLFHAQIGAAGVTNRCDPGPHRGGEIVCRFEEPVGERGLDDPPKIDVVQNQMHMGIEETRQHGAATAVDRLITVQVRPDLEKPTVFDDDIGGAHRLTIEHLPAVEQGPCHGALIP